MKPEARKTSGRCLFGKKTLISRVDRGSWRGLNLNRYTWAPVTAAKGRKGGERRTTNVGRGARERRTTRISRSQRKSKRAQGIYFNYARRKFARKIDRSPVCVFAPRWQINRLTHDGNKDDGKDLVAGKEGNFENRVVSGRMRCDAPAMFSRPQDCVLLITTIESSVNSIMLYCYGGFTFNCVGTGREKEGGKERESEILLSFLSRDKENVRLFFSSSILGWRISGRRGIFCSLLRECPSFVSTTERNVQRYWQGSDSKRKRYQEWPDKDSFYILFD